MKESDIEPNLILGPIGPKEPIGEAHIHDSTAQEVDSHDTKTRIHHFQ